MILTLCGVVVVLYQCFARWPTRHQRTRAWWLGVGTGLIALVGIGYGLATDIVAQKSLALLLMPAGLTWLLLIAVTIGAWRHAPRALAVLASLTLGLFTMSGNSWLGDALMESLEHRIPPLDLSNLQPFEAIFVLGGGTEFSDADGPSFGNSGDRLALAARLWHAGKTQTLVASGSSIPSMEKERDLAAESALLWRSLAVPTTAIIALPPGPVNTTQEIAAYATLIREHGWKRVGLLSSAWHLPRALRLAHTLGLDMVPLGADRCGRFRGWSPYWLIPQDHGFDRIQRACWEYLGMLRGR